MPEYRKRGGRQFYKLTDENVTIKIFNGVRRSEILTEGDWMCQDSIFGEEPEVGVKPCTEEEFHAAKSEAMKRLQSEQI